MKRISKCLSLTALACCLFAGMKIGALAQTDPRAEAVLTQQRFYFLRIRSLKLTAKSDLKLSQRKKEEMSAPYDTVWNELNFVNDARRYRSEVLAYNNGTQDRCTMTWAYNGDLYQFLSPVDPATLVVGHSPLDTNLYGTNHPVLFQYKFATVTGESVELALFENSAKWAQMLEKVVACEETAMLGHSGLKLRFVGPKTTPQGLITSEVFFASDLDYFPIYQKLIFPDGRYAESRVVTTRSYVLDTGPIVIPDRIESTDYGADGIVDRTGTVTVYGDTLEINTPVDDIIFTLPESQARFYRDMDTGMTVEL